MKLTARLLAGGLWLSSAMLAADVAGIWMGQLTAPHEEKQDVAFQFKSSKNTITGTMFGDEFDFPVRDLNLTGDHIEFIVTTTNYYDGSQVKFVFSGNVGDKQMQLTREHVDTGPIEKSAKEKEKNPKQTFTLKKLS